MHSQRPYEAGARQAKKDLGLDEELHPVQPPAPWTQGVDKRLRVSTGSALEKRALFGVGATVAEKGPFGVSVGFPYGVGVHYRLLDDAELSPDIGVGLTGPLIGLNYRPTPDAPARARSKRRVKKSFEQEDRIPGGPADKMKPSDFDPRQLRRGQKHEMEHTNDPAIAREIASDHLVEHPHYYEGRLDHA